MPRKASRNAQGGGTIRQRSDGRWEARYTVGRDPGTGKQIQRSIYGATQKEVRQRLQQITMDIDEGTYTAPSRLTVEEWLNTWLNDYLLDVKPRTIQKYSSTVRNRLIPNLGIWEKSNFATCLPARFSICIMRSIAVQMACTSFPRNPSMTHTAHFTGRCNKLLKSA